MSLILHIDTAQETAGISLARNGEVLSMTYNKEQKDHAAWLHPAIDLMLKNQAAGFGDLQAVAVSIGPGSYTGLRVGLSAAKGYCYSLNIPLLAVGSLEILARSVLEKAEHAVCPLIDARRMEVYTAVYNKSGVEIIPPKAMIIDASSFKEQLEEGPVLFCGSGTKKLQPFLLQTENATFANAGDTNSAFARLAAEKFITQAWADLAYTEPLYIKEFHTTTERS